VTGRRILLLCVAGLLSASALLAIAILLVGRFGSTEGKILGSTALLAGYGLIALPAVMLFDQGRLRALALATASLATVSAALALAFVWTSSHPDALGRLTGTATVLALACTQVSILSTRRRERDSVVVRRLFAASCGTGVLAAVAASALLWAQPHAGTYPRLLGALVVLDLALVALQPVLARARPAGPVHRLRVVRSAGEPVDVTIEGGDLASAGAKAIRSAERDGSRVVGIEVSDGGASCSS
jgi:4-amino-4-deoxy-L-arabinose transferase-like glycosyltransferase